MIELHNAEAWEWLSDNEDRKWDMLFMDPPDNLGINYEGLPADWDKRSESSYYNWLWGLIFDAIHIAPIVWISYYHKHDLEIKRIVAKILKKVKPTWEARTFIWRFNFGQYRVSDCASGYRPILRLSSPVMLKKWNCDAIRIESERQRLGDPRAAGPKVPDDVFEFPRVQGNAIERRAWIPTQHPEALIERIVKLSLNTKKPRILELFTGSGTMIRVVKKLNYGNSAQMDDGVRIYGNEINLDTIELSKEYVQRLREEHPEITVKEG